MVYFLLPEGHIPDPDISLKPGPILLEYFAIIRNPRFATYAIAGAFSFAGLFTYVAGSPIIFMDGFHVSPQTYSLIFAGLSVGFIGCSQINVLLLRWFESESLFFSFVILQVITGAIFLGGAFAGCFGLGATLVLLFVFLGCIGLTNPNASALALGPFTKNAGSASALLGFFQLGVGALISTGISSATPDDSILIIAILAATAGLALVILLAGRSLARASSPVEEPSPVSAC